LEREVGIEPTTTGLGCNNQPTGAQATFKNENAVNRIEVFGVFLPKRITKHKELTASFILNKTNRKR
jgi:hypothetical protein